MNRLGNSLPEALAPSARSAATVARVEPARSAAASRDEIGIGLAVSAPRICSGCRLN
jgi:hypothetical protein